MSYTDKQALNAKRTERDLSQSPAAKRGNQQDFEKFGDRDVRTTAHAPEKADIPDFSDYNEPYADGGGIYAPRPRRNA